jgi:hypothetical protein
MGESVLEISFLQDGSDLFLKAAFKLVQRLSYFSSLAPQAVAEDFCPRCRQKLFGSVGIVWWYQQSSFFQPEFLYHCLDHMNQALPAPINHQERF